MPTTATAEDIQQQQADLQAKILSLLGSNAVVPPSKPAPAAAPPVDTTRRPFGGGGGLPGSVSSGFGIGGSGSGIAGGAYNSYQTTQSQYGGYR